MKLPNIYQEQSQEEYFVKIDTRFILIVDSKGRDVEGGLLIDADGDLVDDVDPEVADKAGVVLDIEDGSGGFYPGASWNVYQCIKTLSKELMKRGN